MGLKDDMNKAGADARAKVLEDNWNKNTSISNVVKKLTSGKGLGSKSAYFTQEPVSVKGQSHGVTLVYREKPVSLELTLNADETFSYTSRATNLPGELNYSGTENSANALANRVYEWVSKMGIAFDDDIHAKIEKAGFKEQAPAPMYRSSEP